LIVKEKTVKTRYTLEHELLFAISGLSIVFYETPEVL